LNAVSEKAAETN